MFKIPFALYIFCHCGGGRGKNPILLEIDHSKIDMICLLT